MKQIQDAYIVAAVRTPVGKAIKGALRNFRPDDLLALAIRNLLLRVPSLDPNFIDDVVIGCSLPEAQQGYNIARIALLLAQLPNTAGGITVNRFCSSGLNAIAMAADRIRVGEADVMIAGGVESMSMVPIMGNTPSMSPSILLRDENIGIAYGMGLTAERVAQQWNISRESQDAFALASHQKALLAQSSGEFSDEIFPVEIDNHIFNSKTNLAEISHEFFVSDEGPRQETSLEALAKLRAIFAANGSVTAGNSSQMSDGAAALLVVSEKALKQFNLTPIARFISFAVKGVAPEIMGIGPKEAIPAALRLAGLKQHDLGWIELNEAFAAQAIAVIQDLALDPSKVNPLGSAIALGHPLGATGAIRSATAIHAMQRHQLRYGMVTMCIGTGMGAAGIFERC